MSLPFLTVFPREIRDQIYTYVLASPSGIVNLSPWTIEVARSLSLLRACKQIHRECKDIIWAHNSLSLREPTQLFEKLGSLLRIKHILRIQHIKICVEMLDRDELEWVGASLKAISGWPHAGSLKSITLRTVWDRPRTVEEFHEALNLRMFGELVDGRLYLDSSTYTQMIVNTGWPHFSHWGKQRWLREMLLDPSGIKELLKGIHQTFGGEMYVDGELCFKDHTMLRKGFILDPRDGEIKIILRQIPFKQKFY